MTFVQQLPYEPDLTGIVTHTTPDWEAMTRDLPSAEEQYVVMRRLQYLRPAQIESVKNRDYHETIHVVILARPDTTQTQIDHSLSTLPFQCYDFISVEVVNILQTPIEAYLANIETCWTAVLHAGDRLTPYALLAAMDHAAANPTALALYTDEETLRDSGPAAPYFRPEFSLEMLRSTPYIGRFLLYRNRVWKRLQKNFNFINADLIAYEMALRIFEITSAVDPDVVNETIKHIAQPFIQTQSPHYGWSVNQRIYSDAQTICREHLVRSKISFTMKPGILPQYPRIQYLHEKTPLVSIIIPVRKAIHAVRKAVESVISKTTYKNYEIILVLTDPTDMPVQSYAQIMDQHRKNISIVHYYSEFNYAGILNAGIEQAKGEYICILHPDYVVGAVAQADWLTTLMGHAQLPDVGVVGGATYHENSRAHHLGVTLGITGIATHAYFQAERSDGGYFGSNKMARESTAVTMSGSLFAKALYDKLGQFDERVFGHYFVDVDFCAKVHKLGYRNVFTPFVSMTTSEIAFADLDNTHQMVKEKRIALAQVAIRKEHMDLLTNDPAHNPHRSLVGIRDELDWRGSIMWDPFARPALPRVLTFPGDRSGCGFYRTRGPLNAMIRQGIAEGISSEWMMPTAATRRLRPDVLVAQRQINPDQLAHLREYSQYMPDTYRIYELDDPLHLIPPKSVHYGQFPKDVLELQVAGMTLCDRLVVSTNELANVFSPFHKNIVVRNNRLPVEYWKHIRGRDAKSVKPRVGWGGGSSHQGDLELITEVVKHFKDKVDWIFFGMCPDSIRPYIKEFHPGVPIDNYPAMLASLGLDLGVAPLETNTFNACKSNLRLLEYGACGYPVVASDVAAFRYGFPSVTLVKDGRHGWISAIEEMLSDRVRLKERGETLRKYIHANWMLEAGVTEDWLKAWLP